MKKNITNIVSPFIMLLVPLFLLIGVLAMNVNNEMPAEKQRASIKLQVPTLKSFFQAAVGK
ncbi:hypothetical protein [Daejeonella sp. JGW-45]|uniref:hypothetical protein n=1 Tax=Daejeonella sp. JGW-45 TaxID=3034148 RepID=UPI0023ED69FD|nr:hypothetical protein [Daejeonella sp. JGW-45]